MITVEKANVRDVEEIKQLLSDTWKVTYSSFLPQEVITEVASTWHSVDNLISQIQNPNTIFKIAKDYSGKIVGLITLNNMDNDKIMLSRLYIHPNLQKQGIGRMLFEEGIKELPAAKIIKLEVEKENINAQGFYSKLGFKVVKEKEEPFNEYTFHVLVMEKQIQGLL